MVSGFFDVQNELEKRFARWLNVDKSILFSSGYLANLGVITALANRHSTIFTDKLCHASILDGVQLSRATHYRYHHHSMSHLTQLAMIKKPDFIVTEGVFSMRGDIAPLNKLAAIADRYQSALVIDDAHGVGIFGRQGQGTSYLAHMTQQQFSCLITPLGKAFAAMGAMVSGSQLVIESILQFAKCYRYNTAIPPALCLALLETLDIISHERWRRERLRELILFFIDGAIARGLQLVSYDATPIKSIIIDHCEQVLVLHRKILSTGFYVACIRPPTVPTGSARIRISLNCLHSKNQITRLLDVITEYFDEK